MQVERLGIHKSVATLFPPERLREELADAGVDIAVVGDDVAGNDAVVTFEHREAFTSLDWVHSIQAGVDRFPFDEYEAAGAALTNSTGIHDTAVGETVAGYMLSFARRLHRHRDHQGDREWSQPDWDEAFTLDGESICVVGLGTLGRGIAERANGLGMRVTGVRRSGEPVEGVSEVFFPDQIDEAVVDATFVAVAVPLTEETAGFVDESTFESMHTDAYLVNVARGPVVNQDALVAALQDGEIAGAALDVFDPEPLPESSPLWGMDEVIVTPHCAAFTRDYFRDIADLVRVNLDRIAANEELHNRVV